METVTKKSSVAKDLDLFSTSQRFSTCAALCVNNAPLFATKTAGRKYRISQGSCNSWACPRCGQLRAKYEYGRMVAGCRTLAEKHELFFITITCQGRGLSVSDAENNYKLWTNRLNTRLRSDARSRGLFWAYVAVTERQRRGHPHSHYITTYYPKDLVAGTKTKYATFNGVRISFEVEALRSASLLRRVTNAGLGSQYDISKVRETEAASRYVAKYLFKASMFETNIWRKNWKRIRYSNSFPKLEKKPPNPDTIVLVTGDSWRELNRKSAVLGIESPYVLRRVMDNQHILSQLIKLEYDI